MNTDRTPATSQHSNWPNRLQFPALLIIAAAALTHVTRLVADHTVAVVWARHLLPRWDLSTHLGHGWLDYHLLTSGQILQLLWDFWLQGYWPPLPSIYQMPFYLVLGGGMTSGLLSSLVAFALVGLTGCALMWRQWKSGGLLPASVFLALLMSSPFLLAYASVPMTEILGALAQLLVLLSYQRYRDNSTRPAARFFAISLSVLFFTKYNYFLLLVVPLAVLEWLERSPGMTIAARLKSAGRWTWRVLSTPTGILVGLYAVGLIVVMTTGGFDFNLLGRRISVHGIGNTGHVVLYLLLLRLWFLHRRGRTDWARLTSADPRIRPLLIWFVLPVTAWMASPYPNHIRDFFNLVFNRPLGESAAGAGVATYLDVLRTSYFYSDWVLVAAAAVFGLAALRYRHQQPLMRWLILAVPLQFAAIALHHTRVPRFLLLSVVVLCLTASSEIGRWLAGSRRGRLVAGLLAPIVLAAGVMAAEVVVTEPRFDAIAFENYTDSRTLREALDGVRSDLNAGERLAVVGQSNELSPALFRWELGPPSGMPCFPNELAGARKTPLALVTQVLLIAPISSDSGQLDPTSYYLTQRDAVLDQVGRRELVLRRETALPDLRVSFRIYDRVQRPQQVAPCQ